MMIPDIIRHNVEANTLLNKILDLYFSILSSFESSLFHVVLGLPGFHFKDWLVISSCPSLPTLRKSHKCCNMHCCHCHPCRWHMSKSQGNYLKKQYRTIMYISFIAHPARSQIQIILCNMDWLCYVIRTCGLKTIGNLFC